MNVKILTKLEEVDISRDTWNKLVSRNETNTIFQTYDWFKSWWTIFGQNNQLFLICVYENDKELLGIAPLAIINNAPNSKRFLMFTGDGNADYLDFIIPRYKEFILNLMLKAIKEKKKYWDDIVLRNIPSHSTTTGLLVALSKTAGFHGSIEKIIACPTLLISNHEKEAKHCANKYSTKRAYNYFNKSGKLSHEIINNLNTVDNLLDDFFNQHIERWHGTQTPSLFLSKKNKEFYRLLAKALLPSKQLLFSFIKYNTNTIAYHFGFDYNSVITWYKPSFDAQYAKHSPGIVMVRYLINYCLDNNRNELDFTIGNESFKKRFTNMKRYNNNLRLFYNSPRYFLYRFIYFIKSVAKHLIGKSE